jgi:hypothetical protein
MRRCPGNLDKDGLMSLPFSLPDWMPWWAMLVILVPVLIYGLALLFMPFNTIGVKGRLDLIEARLDEIQGEIRALALRLPERGGAELPPPTYREASRGTPPIPPVAGRGRRAPEPVDMYDDEAEETAYEDEPDRYRAEMEPPARPARPPAYPPSVAPAPRPDSRPDMPRRPPGRRPDQRPEPGRAEPRIDWPR